MTKLDASLVLVRHAIAEDRSDEWPDDARRPLTHRGVSRMREAARGLMALDLEIDLVLTSPLVRAQQTADVLVDALKPSPSLATVGALAPGAAIAQLTDELTKHPKGRVLALVGHEPGLGELAAWLLGARVPLAFKKGGAACIDVPTIPPARGTGQMRWFATPRMLRALARSK